MACVLCEMKDGHPRSAGGEYFGKPQGEDFKLLSDLLQEEQIAVLQWIMDNIEPRKTPNFHHSSYGIKALVERDCNFYISNNQMKDAMLIAGYKPAKINELNWYFSISEKSEAFRKKVW